MKSSAMMIPAIALILAIPASAAEEQSKAAASRVKTEERSSVTSKGDAAASVTVSKVTATVKDIDLASRMVTLVGKEGNEVVVQAGDKVRNLDKVKVGDKVTVEYYEGVVAELKAPGTAKPTGKVEVTEGMIRAKPGEQPAGAVGNAITATVVIEHVDAMRNVVQFKGPAGKTRTVNVQKPEFRKMLKTLKVGDQVELTFFEAVAIGVTPAGK